MQKFPLRISAIFSLALLLGTGLSLPVKAETCFRRDIQTELIDGMAFCVSSYLQDQGSGSYGPENLSHSVGKLAGAWCEGSRGNGKGDWAEQSFRPMLPVRTINISNGYQKSEATFAANGRVRRVRITTNNGTLVETELRDTQEEQQIRLPDWEDLTSFRLTILSAYPGTKYSDTCITHMRADIEEQRELEFEEMNQ